MKDFILTSVTPLLKADIMNTFLHVECVSKNVQSSQKINLPDFTLSTDNQKELTKQFKLPIESFN